MTAIELPLLGDDPASAFPPAWQSLKAPNGLLAMGGDLSPTRLLHAYRRGIFPWYGQGQPILWWCPDPRMTFTTDAVHLSRRTRQRLRGSGWTLRADNAFAEVVDICADIPRHGEQGTWITPAMRAAYSQLHRLGHAHSIEVMSGEQLVGGLYGVAIGRMFFAESMFSIKADASKAALAGLAALLHDRSWPLIDAQMENPHLRSLGARPMPRAEFLVRIAELCAHPEPPGSWQTRVDERPVRG